MWISFIFPLSTDRLSNSYLYPCCLFTRAPVQRVFVRTLIPLHPLPDTNLQSRHQIRGLWGSWSQQISNYKINLWNVLYLETKSQSRYLHSPYVFNYLNSSFYELSFNLRWLHVEQMSCNCPLTFSTENFGTKIWKNNSENFPSLVSVGSVRILYLCFVG